jgi:hypothetical protein
MDQMRSMFDGHLKRVDHRIALVRPKELEATDHGSLVTAATSASDPSRIDAPSPTMPVVAAAAASVMPPQAPVVPPARAPLADTAEAEEVDGVDLGAAAGADEPGIPEPAVGVFMGGRTTSHNPVRTPVPLSPPAMSHPDLPRASAEPESQRQPATRDPSHGPGDDDDGDGPDINTVYNDSGALSTTQAERMARPRIDTHDTGL